jgi:hypothetical protein
MATWVQIAAAVTGFVGALLLAVSQQAGSPTMALIRGDKRDPLVVLRHPRLWRVGLVLLCLGFVLQIIALLFGGK